MSSATSNEGGMLGEINEMEDVESATPETAQRDVDVTWLVREGLTAQHEQDSERYSIKNERQATLDPKVREPVNTSAENTETREVDLMREAKRIMEKIRQRKGIVAPESDSLSDNPENAPTTDYQPKDAELPPPSNSPYYTGSPLQLLRRISAFEDASTDDYRDDYQLDDTYSAKQHQAPAPIEENIAMIYNPRQNLAKMPVTSFSFNDPFQYVDDLILEVDSGDRSDSHDTNKIAPGKSPATTESNIKNSSGTSISSISEDDLEAQLAAQTAKEEEAAEAKWLVEQNASNGIYSKSPATEDDGSLVISNQRIAQVRASAEHLLTFIFCDLGLEETFSRAQERVPDFTTWLRLKIDLLATSLETELKANSPATDYLSIYSNYLAAHAVQKLGRKTNASGTQPSESSASRQDKGKMHGTEIRSPEDILEDIVVEKLPEVFGGEFSEPAAWARLSSTKSFRVFASDLSDAAYPTFFSECRKALKAEIDSEVHGLWDRAEERYLLSILMEMQCSARQDREFSLSIECSGSVLWLDRLKLFIERSSGSEWSWWPLSPPPRAESPAYVQLATLDIRHQLSSTALWLFPESFAIFIGLPGSQFAISLSRHIQHVRVSNYGSFQRQFLIPAITYIFSGTLLFVLASIAAYVTVFAWQHVLSKGWLKSIQSHEDHGNCTRVISWLCTCGCTRRELVSTKYANLFQQLTSKFPMTCDDNNPIQAHGLCVPRTSSPNSSSGSSSPTDTQSVDSADSTGGGSSRGSVSTAPSSTGSTSITLDFDRKTFVHLLVRKGDRYVLSPMKASDRDARHFFQDLIVRYQQQRGFLRRFLSIFVYSHCDFVKVKHHRAYRFSPIPGFSFPEPGRDIEYDEYTYNPQPMTQAPITKHMFNDYFYSCYDSQNMKHAFIHKFLSSCDVIQMLPQDLLESMPKRDREVMVGAQFGRVEHFWGLVAREQRSALRIILYMLLSLMPTVWFMFMWMFSWGHEGDLQNATVPVTISLATLSMVWVVVYSGGDSGNE